MFHVVRTLLRLSLAILNGIPFKLGLSRISIDVDYLPHPIWISIRRLTPAVS